MPPPQGIPPANAPIPVPLSAEKSRQITLDAAPDEIPEGADPRIRQLLLGDDMEEAQRSNRTDAAQQPSSGLMPQTQAAVAAMTPNKQKLHPQPILVSPARHPYPAGIAASPSRLRSSSPRLYSPASSEIFERNVQEPVPMSTLQGDLDQAHIPAHMMTEDHIPPALEASAQAITSEDLDADDVEIVTSTSHQPAAASMMDVSNSHAELPQVHSPPTLQHHPSDASDPASFGHQSGFLPTTGEDDAASTYGQLDPTDVRRVSFISFADVRQSEHQHQPSSLREVSSRDDLSVAQAAGREPTASPLRSPRSPTSTHSQSLSSGGGVVTPPAPFNANPFGSELSPARSAISQHGELTIETMRQALRKTASGDLGGARSAGMSPVLADESPLKQATSRTDM